MATTEKKLSKRTVRQSLIDQLRRKNADVEVFMSQVEDYMKLWDLKEKLAKDIKQRGITFKDSSSYGVPMVKQNPSTKELIAVSAQMLKILAQLNISTDKIIADDDDTM